MSVLRDRSLTLLILLVAAVLAGMVLQATGYLQPVEDAIFSVLAPVQYSFQWVSGKIAGWAQTLRDLRSLQARAQELQETVDHLMIENVRLREADIERAQLREQLQFKQANPTYESLGAEVIGHDPSNLLHYITIDRGAKDGLAIGMPVVTARGLVGKITSVFPQSARVMLLTDPASSVNALIQSSRATGVVQGHGQGGLIMRFLEQSEQVEVGDIVLTSGLGGNMPKRFVIGQVTAVRRNDVEMFAEVHVQSAVYFDRIEMVQVIQSFAPIDYAP